MVFKINGSIGEKLDMKCNEAFWNGLQRIVDKSNVIIDKYSGSCHPGYPNSPVYPLDYGFLDKTVSVNNGGIDCFLGTLRDNKVYGVLCTVDQLKKNFEIKVLIACTNEEMELAHQFLNKFDFFSALLVKRFS